LGGLAFDEDIGRNLATMLSMAIHYIYIYYINIFNRKIILQTPFVRFHDKFRGVTSEE